MSVRFFAAAISLFLVPAAALAGYRTSSWIPGWDNNALISTQTNAGKLTESNPTWYKFNSDGTLAKKTAAEDPTWRAAMTGTALLPTIQNTGPNGFDKALAVSVLSTTENRERHAQEILQLVLTQNYDGVDIDYENLPASSKDDFTAFLRTLADELHSYGKILSVTVYAKTSDSATWDGPGGEDYLAIGGIADWVKIMAYDKHYPGSQAGAITPLAWLDQVLAYAVAKLPASKIMVGLPWYGYDWLGTSAVGVTYQEAVNTANSQGATITYDENGEATYAYSSHVVYFNDALSYSRKVDLVLQKYPGIGGFSHWRNGAEDPETWKRVDALKNGGSTATAPPAPTNLSASTASATAVNLAWSDNAANEDGFRVERCIGTSTTCDSAGTYAQVAQLGANASSYTDNGLSSATTYSYRVRAFNSGGNSTYSNSAEATTQTPLSTNSSTLVAAGALWRYLDNGSDQGTAWRAVSFDDAGWASGPAQLGYGDGDEKTVVGYGSSSTNKYVTTYFRYAFTVSDPGSYTSLTLSFLRDDGAVVYLNGAEVTRSNMPAGTIGYRTYAAGGVVPPEESTFFDFSVDPRLLVSGKNIVAVEVHQSDGGSSDISFDLQFAGKVAAPTIASPTNLQASAVSPFQINLSWTDNADNENGFRIERCLGYGCAVYAEIATVAANSTSHSDVGLTASTTYSYRVRAYDASGNSNYSNSAAATTNAVPPPASPGSLTAAAASSGQINLTWADNSADEDGFRIERCTGSGCTAFSQIASLGSNTTGYSDTGVGGSTTYAYRALAFNAGGDSAYSNTASATTPAPPQPVGPQTFIPAGAVWKYLDNGSDQGTAWTGIWFDETGWRSGTAQLGYGDGDETTVVSYGPDSGNKYLTTYFRSSFDVANPTAYRSLKIRLMRDDGAVVYFNGGEVMRSNMPTGTIGYRTYAASGVVPPEESTFFEISLGSQGLVAGKNVVAVEVHQSDAGSSDISFDLELLGSDQLAPPAAPTNLQASTTSDSSIKLSWTDNSAEESGFRIERCTGSSCTDFAVIATVGANMTSYVNTGLRDRTYYRYRVQAFSAAGDSAYSNIGTAKTWK